MSAAAAGRLHLVPVPLAAGEGRRGAARPAWTEDSVRAALPAPAIELVRGARYFLVENARTARAFLKAAGHPGPLDALQIVEIGHEPRADEAAAWLAPLRGAAAPGVDAVVLSEAGAPAIADPGAVLVAQAHELGIEVRPWPGPSSILLALMASGMNGQRFRFLGYLPQELDRLLAQLGRVQEDARQGETQIFIETPYRNARLFETLLAHADARLKLCLAVNLCAPDALVQTRPIARWRALPAAQRPDLDRRPTVFLLNA